ncbi:MAG: hypothetical protein KW793_01105, partial [Candidatus Doudnabacteria bacterium]|nr:hypothetical protein [Candidatus Doudnabacteria bacterium]
CIGDQHGIDGAELLFGEGILCVGIGKHWFDEHGRPDYDKTCAAMLTAKFLGLENEEAAMKLAHMALFSDRESKTRPSELSNAIKIWNRPEIAGPEYTMVRASKLLLGYYNLLRGKAVSDSEPFSTAKLMRKFVKLHPEVHDVKSLGKQFYAYFMEADDLGLIPYDSDFHARGLRPLEMGHLIRLMPLMFQRRDRHEAESRALMVLRHFMIAGQLFQQSWDWFKPRFVHFTPKFSHRVHRYVVLVTDDPNAVKVAMNYSEVREGKKIYLGADAVIVVSPTTGNIQIMTKEHSRYDLKEVYLQLCRIEYIADGLPIPENLEEVGHPRVYAFKKNGIVIHVFNGTNQSQQKVPPTKGSVPGWCDTFERYAEVVPPPKKVRPIASVSLIEEDEDDEYVIH